MSSSLRSLAAVSKRVAARPALTRSLHSPFAVSGSGPSRLREAQAMTLTQHQDYTDVEEIPYRGTYVVCQPDGSAMFNQVPLGAYPVSAPYADFANGFSKSAERDGSM